MHTAEEDIHPGLRARLRAIIPTVLGILRSHLLPAVRVRLLPEDSPDLMGDRRPIHTEVRILFVFAIVIDTKNM